MLLNRSGLMIRLRIQIVSLLVRARRTEKEGRISNQSPFLSFGVARPRRQNEEGAYTKAEAPGNRSRAFRQRREGQGGIIEDRPRKRTDAFPGSPSARTARPLGGPGDNHARAHAPAG